MSKRRISNTERPRDRPGQPNRSQLKFVRFSGISISGGKNEKTVVAVIDYYENHNKLVLTHLYEDLKSDPEVSNDESLINLLKSLGNSHVLAAFDAPLRLPSCITCRLDCPGIPKCEQPHIAWFWEHYKKIKKNKKTVKLFTPYTQRPVESVLTYDFEEAFHPSDALGANTAPLTARMNYLSRHLGFVDLIEVFPKISVWRIGRSLKIPKRYLRFHKHSVDGEKSRMMILDQISERGVLFAYKDDLNRMISNGNSFDAMITALTAFLKYKSLTMPRPQGFPLQEDWIEIPVENCF